MSYYEVDVAGFTQDRPPFSSVSGKLSERKRV